MTEWRAPFFFHEPRDTSDRRAGPSPSFIYHHDGERNHQGLGNAFVFLDTTALAMLCRSVLSSAEYHNRKETEIGTVSLKKGELVDFEAHLVGRSRNAAKPRVKRGRKSTLTADRMEKLVPSIYSSARTELAKLLIYALFRKIRVLAQDDHVLFVIDIATRCVCIGGITSDPNGEWMKQVARNLTDMWDGFLLGKRYLIHDRDPLFTEAVRGLLRDSGVKPLRLPANSPNLNAYAERFVLSIRRECLDRFVPLSERHLRTAVTEYVVHYHTERNHQGLGNELLTPLPASANDTGPIVSRERLGGILNYYCRAA